MYKLKFGDRLRNPNENHLGSPITTLFLFVTLCLPLTANATLGEPIVTASIKPGANDQSGLAVIVSTQKIVNSNVTYEIHETTGEGNTIREYVNQDGIVFAITWQGPIKPDLPSLLGNYHIEFSNLEKNHLQANGRVYSRAPRQFKSSKIVVQKSGTFHHSRGRAYAPNLIPDGVIPDELK